MYCIFHFGFVLHLSLSRSLLLQDTSEFLIYFLLVFYMFTLIGLTNGLMLRSPPPAWVSLLAI